MENGLWLLSLHFCIPSIIKTFSKPAENILMTQTATSSLDTFIQLENSQRCWRKLERTYNLSNLIPLTKEKKCRIFNCFCTWRLPVILLRVRNAIEFWKTEKFCLCHCAFGLPKGSNKTTEISSSGKPAISESVPSTWWRWYYNLVSLYGLLYSATY